MPAGAKGPECGKRDPQRLRLANESIQRLGSNSKWLRSFILFANELNRYLPGIRQFAQLSNSPSGCARYSCVRILRPNLQP
jgi:hypothetical protein